MVVPSSGFTYPPTNGSIPPALAIDFHLEYNPNHLFAILHNVEDFTQTEITYELLAHAVHHAAHILNPNGTIPQGTNVGFLVSTHTIEYVVMIMGAMRAGLVPFPISPRTHIPGIAHLITTTQTKYIVSGGSKVIDDVTTQLRDTLSSSHFVAEFIQLPSLEEVLPSLGHIKTQGQYTPFPPLKPFGDDSIVNILHSSGSTGLPRPIQYHLEGVIKNVVKQPLGWIYSGGNVTVGTMALPTFHTMGMLLQVILPLYVGYTQVLFAPSKSPVVPTSNLTIQAVASTNCEYLICVPTFLEMWAQDEDAIASLCEMKGVMFGGGPLADAIGNKLVDRGVLVHSCYGATEFGAVNEIQNHDDPSDWGYVKFSQRVGTRFVPQNDEDGTFELIFVETEAHKPFVLNSELDGMPAYRTKDLVVQHPHKPDLWKFVGRLDDQIALLNGEKTNPGPMEAEIVKSPIVNCAIMFGRERNQTGVLIELTPNASGDHVAEHHRTKLIEEVWPYVEHANQTSPTHSRLAKSTVIFVDPARPLPRTPKGTVPRSAALKLYSREIEDMYISLEKYANGTEDIETPESWSDRGIVEAWVQACVADILGQDVDPTGDLFQQGMDSLTATILLRTLKGVLHASPDPIVQDSAKQINQQTIFGKPTVRQLSNLLVQLCTNSGNSGLDPVAEALESIHMMIEKYNYDWVPSGVDAATRNQPVVQERVVVTGTTGGLGSHLLAQLLASDKVDRVWALNRKSGKDNLARQQASFEDKQLDIELLAGSKLVMLDTDLEDAKLGLCDEIYDEIRNQATIIIHNAWQVNFNLSLQSFEPSIHGARNLLDLGVKSTAITGMPRFAFASSISVAGFGEPGRRLSEAPVKPEEGAAGIGYGQSKLVTEKLLESARLAGLQTCSVRLGQLTGDVKSGAWTSTDWVPSLIGSSVSIGCLPEAVGTVSWLPLDIAAHSIIDTCTSRHEDLPLIIHTSHPRPVPWVDVMSAFSAVLSSLPLVRFDEWNKRVVENAAAFEGSESDRYKRFPSTKIQSTVDGMVRADEALRARGVIGDVESGGTVRLDTSEAERLSEALKVTSQVGKEHVEKWVGYWGKMGLFL